MIFYSTNVNSRVFTTTKTNGRSLKIDMFLVTTIPEHVSEITAVHRRKLKSYRQHGIGAQYVYQIWVVLKTKAFNIWFVRLRYVWLYPVKHVKVGVLWILYLQILDLLLDQEIIWYSIFPNWKYFKLNTISKVLTIQLQVEV